MPASPRTIKAYVLGHSQSELQRLVHQAELLRPLTEHVLRRAGIEAGMRVLDLGCGGGDVSFLIAEMVGSSGSVVGVDRAREATDTARQRARNNQIPNVRFVCTTLDELNFADRFDAVVGRMILHHQVDPVATVRQAAAHVRKDGVIAFQEPDHSLRVCSSWPRTPLLEASVSRIVQVLQQSGVHADMGKKLHETFRAANLPAPEMLHERAIGAKYVPAISAIIAEMVRTLLPKMEEFGLATADEVQIESLAERIEAELVAADAVVMGTPMVGAWARKP